MTSSEAAVHTLLDNRIEAGQDKDIDRLMSLFAPEIVYYDAVPPLQFTGTDQVRRNFERWFHGYDGPISLTTKDLTVAVSGELAFANMLHLDSGKRTNGLDSSIWVRSSLCCRLFDGEWLITHEHISIPIEPETLRAWLAPVD